LETVVKQLLMVVIGIAKTGQKLVLGLQAGVVEKL
jgi:transposase-like protein